MKKKLVFGSFIACLIIALPMRVYEFFTVIEKETGFYSKTGAVIYILYAVLFIGAIVPVVLSYMMRKEILPIKQNIHSVLFAVITAVLALSLILSSVDKFSEAMTLYSKFTPTATQTMLQYMMKSGGIMLIFETVFAVLSAIYFFVLALSKLLKKSDGAGYKFLALAPALWCVFRIIHRFMRTISFVNVSDLLFELVMLVFLMLFFFNYAQITTKINTSNNYWKLFAYGFPAALFCLLCFVPRFILMTTGNGSMLATQHPVEYCDLAVALFIILQLSNRFQLKNKTRA